MAFVFTPLLETMSAAARIAYPHIVGAVSKGLGTEAIIKSIGEAGLQTFRRQDMLALIREARNGELLKSDIARWPKEMPLPLTRVRESLTKIVAPFSYTLRVKVIDAEGEERIITRQAHSNVLRSSLDVARSFIRAAAGREQYEELEIVDAEVIDVQRAGSEGSL